MTAPASWDDLTDAEAAELAALHTEWKNARARRNYPLADRLRARLKDAGAMGRNLDLWHPVWESSAHREARINARAQQPAAPARGT